MCIYECFYKIMNIAKISKIGKRHPPPVTVVPTFLDLPDFVVGIPTERDIRFFALDTPIALFGEKERPGIPVFDFRLDISFP